MGDYDGGGDSSGGGSNPQAEAIKRRQDKVRGLLKGAGLGDTSQAAGGSSGG